MTIADSTSGSLSLRIPSTCVARGVAGHAHSNALVDLAARPCLRHRCRDARRGLQVPLRQHAQWGSTECGAGHAPTIVVDIRIDRGGTDPAYGFAYGRDRYAEIRNAIVV